MAKSENNTYAPDYVVAPGTVLDDYLEASNLTQVALAERTGMAKKTINEIIKGKSPITPETALKLERVLGRPAHFWSNLERQYQDDLARQQERERLKANLSWLKTFPLRDMVANGMLAKHEDKLFQLDALLNFFGVASPEQWDTVWKGALPVAYRQTRRNNHYEAVAAWLRQGELAAQKVRCADFDRRRFREALNDIRDFTMDEPDDFVPRMQALCAEAGVVLLFIRELPRAGVYGATRWMNGTPVIQMSLYRKTNDHFWFTFFHEAGHILKHGRKDVFIERKGLDDAKEQEANAFACNHLVPSLRYAALIRAGHPSLQAIRDFANEIGVAPGIVVGRLQHDGVLPMSVGNKLKVHFDWREQAE